MPSISNLQLTIERNSNPDQGSPRRVSVSFTTNFTATEMFAHVVYRADVIIRSQADEGEDPNSDNTTTHFVGTKIITSATNQVQTAMRTALQRIQLNEDFDTRIVRGAIVPLPEDKRDDEWVAEVKLSPHIFPTVTAQSPQVVGSWGFLGQD